MTEHPSREAAVPVPTAVERITRYDVSCLTDERDAIHFTITVEDRGDNRWAVCWAGRGCLNAATDEWDYEMRPSEREDDWLAAHRFDLDTALAHARRLAPTLTVNGWTVADVLARTAKEK